jgi:hypothetical protein
MTASRSSVVLVFCLRSTTERKLGATLLEQEQLVVGLHLDLDDPAVLFGWADWHCVLGLKLPVRKVGDA